MVGPARTTGNLHRQNVSIVTFTSDFGTVDGYVGAMKGVVLGSAPSATLVDITHEIPRHDVAAGAFALAQAAPWFPGGTIHVAVVDPGVGTTRAAVVVETDTALFVGPDNGLLSLAAPSPRAVHAIAAPDFRRPDESHTFHGRDVFARAAGRLAQGASARDAGPPLPSLIALPGAGEGGQPGPDQATVIHVDAFGNLVTSWPGVGLEAGTWMLSFSHDQHEVPVLAARTYGDVEPGAVLAYVGSGGLVEIAVREGSAAERFGLGRGDRIVLVKP